MSKRPRLFSILFSVAIALAGPAAAQTPSVAASGVQLELPLMEPAPVPSPETTAVQLPVSAGSAVAYEMDQLLDGAPSLDPENLTARLVTTVLDSRTGLARRSAAMMVLATLGDETSRADLARELDDGTDPLRPGAGHRAAAALAALPAPTPKALEWAVHALKDAPASVLPSLYDGKARGGKPSADAGAPLRYNEAVDASGELRPAYQALERRLGRDPLLPPEAAIQALAAGHPLGDCIRVLPIPLVLPKAETESRLLAGSKQRLRGLMSFFGDVVFGKGWILKDRTPTGFGPGQGLGLEGVRAIFKEEGWNLDGLRTLWRGKSLDDLNALYGPDVVRNPSGQFVVLEDNAARGVKIGGSADIGALQRAWRREIGLPQEQAQGTDFLAEAVRRFLEHHRAEAKDVLALQSGHAEVGRMPAAVRLHRDTEDWRELRALRAQGIRVLDPEKLSKKELEKIAAGGYAAIINLDDPTDVVKNEAYLRAVTLGKTPLFSSPGFSAMGSKAFLPYVDNFIRYYLYENPILPSQPTRIMTDEDLKALLKRAGTASNARWVVKLASGLQGKDVHILGRLSRAEQTQILRGIARERAEQMSMGRMPLTYVIQERLEPSVLPASRTPSWANFYVDVRPLTAAFGERDIFVNPVPWGRSTPTFGSGLNNVSQGAYELAVLLEDVGR